MNYSHRFFLYAPVALLLAIAAVTAVYWDMAAGSVFRALDAANGHDIAPGVTLHFASREGGGFPFRVENLFRNVRIDVATGYGPLTWQSERFAMHALTYGREQIVYEAAGRQTVSWTDSKRRHHVWSFVPGSMRASSIVLDGHLARFDMDIAGIGSDDLSAGRAQLHLRRDPANDVIDISLSSGAIHLASRLQSGFGDTIKSLNLEGEFVPGRALVPLLEGKSGWRSGFERWRNADGHFRIDRFELAWGKLDASGKGTLDLDAMHRPQGSLALTLRGYRDFLKQAQPGADTPLVSALIADRRAANPETLPLTLRFRNGIVMAGASEGGIVNPLY